MASLISDIRAGRGRSRPGRSRRRRRRRCDDLELGLVISAPLHHPRGRWPAQFGQPQELSLAVHISDRRPNGPPGARTLVPAQASPSGPGCSPPPRRRPVVQQDARPTPRGELPALHARCRARATTPRCGAKRREARTMAAAARITVGPVGRRDDEPLRIAPPRPARGRRGRRGGPSGSAARPLSGRRRRDEHGAHQHHPTSAGRRRWPRRGGEVSRTSSRPTGSRAGGEGRVEAEELELLPEEEEKARATAPARPSPARPAGRGSPPGRRGTSPGRPGGVRRRWTKVSRTKSGGRRRRERTIPRAGPP